MYLSGLGFHSQQKIAFGRVNESHSCVLIEQIYPCFILTNQSCISLWTDKHADKGFQCLGGLHNFHFDAS